MNIREAIKGFMFDGKVERQSPDYLAMKQTQLERFATFCEKEGIVSLEAVTIHHLRAFVVQLQETKANANDVRKPDKLLAPGTIATAMRIVKAFFNWCEREGLISINPCRRLTNIRKPKIHRPTFSPEQLEAMLASFDTSTPLGFRDFVILLMLMDTGLRVGELVGLTLENVHDDYVKVLGKGQKEREVGIGPTAYRELWKYINRFRHPAHDLERHVFLTRRGKKMSRQSIWRIVSLAGQQAGIADVRDSPHTFRHTFSRTFLAKKGDVFTLSRVLGHSDVKTTQEYLTDFQSSEARVDHEQYSPVELYKLGRSKRKKSG